MAVSYDDKQTSMDLVLDEAQTVSGWTFDELYRSFKDELVEHARQRGAEDPDGIADLALFDGYRALDRLRGRSTASIRSYLLRAVRSHVATERRAAANVDLTDTIDEADDSHTESFEAELTQGLLLEELIDSLPESQQAVLNHRFRHGLNGAEIAEALNKKPNAVYQLQFRALNNLRLLLVAATFAVALAFVALWTLRPQGQDLIDVSPVDGPAPSVPAVVEGDADTDSSDDEQSAGVSTNSATATSAPLVRLDAAPLVATVPATEDAEITDFAPEPGDEPDAPADPEPEGIVATSDRPIAAEAPTTTTSTTSTTVTESSTTIEASPRLAPDEQAIVTTSTTEMLDEATPVEQAVEIPTPAEPPSGCEVQIDWGSGSGVEVYTLDEDHTSEYIFFTSTQDRLTRTPWLVESLPDRLHRAGRYEREWRPAENPQLIVAKVYFVATVVGDGHSDLVRCDRV